MMQYEYEESKRIAAQGFSFYGLLMAVIRQADTDNFQKLQLAFPGVCKELRDRYNAPGGYLPGENHET